ncbi:MAG: ferredoxin [Candidatus Eremiobacteraeota bacterium]|jgi:ferredoxin-like protein FixX|nr:ferredoxin [Candidatus Eremiobacteraeota bacterium]
MIANYGYTDGSGEYYISINTSFCAECQTHPCISACPQGVFEMITDDYDEPACSVKDSFRKKLNYTCSTCKPARKSSESPLFLPCVQACVNRAIKHTW